MKAVLLDADTLGQWQADQDIETNVNLLPLSECFEQLDIYGLTKPEQVIERCQDKEVIITNKVVIDRSLMQQLPQLKVIQLAATGMNNIDLIAAKEMGIQCFNVADYSTFAVAQLTLSFILNAANRTCEHHLLTKSGAWQQSRMFTLTNYPTMEVAGKNLLLIGYGNIGKKVEQLARAFDMKVQVANIPGRPFRENQIGLQESLPQADFVSLHCPLTDETKHLVNSDFLRQMKSTAHLINTARGPIIDETALAEALINRQIAGASLDVLSQEPPSPDNPLLQDKVPNIIITPHIAWASFEAKQRLIEGMVNNLKSLNNVD
ncbi:MAG: D-2-hydroxyacid dehydrogenase [Kangiellaceae bacterium]|nr:D-2-hydroxyacid dehydrogenase [Kangiellaceae bacterium]